MPEPERSIVSPRPREAELAAFADGTLPPQRRRALAGQVDADRHLRAVVAEQRTALRSIRAIDVPAPPALMGAVLAGAAPPGRRPAFARRRPGPVPRWTARWSRPAGAAAAAATATTIAVLTGSGGAGGPSVARAAALGALPATAAPPAADRGRLALLRQSVEQVAFPDWSARFQLVAVGQRTDELAGRQAKTVFYAGHWAGQTIGYTIVAGRPLALGGPASTLVRGGTRFYTMRVDGRAVVTWQRGGHTCILSSSGAVSTGLVALASSTVRGSAWYRAPSRAWTAARGA